MPPSDPARAKSAPAPRQTASDGQAQRDQHGEHGHVQERRLVRQELVLGDHIRVRPVVERVRAEETARRGGRPGAATRHRLRNAAHRHRPRAAGEIEDGEPGGAEDAEAERVEGADEIRVQASGASPRENATASAQHRRGPPRRRDPARGGQADPAGLLREGVRVRMAHDVTSSVAVGGGGANRFDFCISRCRGSRPRVAASTCRAWLGIEFWPRIGRWNSCRRASRAPSASSGSAASGRARHVAVARAFGTVAGDAHLLVDEAAVSENIRVGCSGLTSSRRLGRPGSARTGRAIRQSPPCRLGSMSRSAARRTRPCAAASVWAGRSCRAVCPRGEASGGRQSRSQPKEGRERHEAVARSALRIGPSFQIDQRHAIRAERPDEPLGLERSTWGAVRKSRARTGRWSAGPDQHRRRLRIVSFCAGR